MQDENDSPKRSTIRFPRDVDRKLNAIRGKLLQNGHRVSRDDIVAFLINNATVNDVVTQISEARS